MFHSKNMCLDASAKQIATLEENRPNSKNCNCFDYDLREQLQFFELRRFSSKVAKYVKILEKQGDACLS